VKTYRIGRHWGVTIVEERDGAEDSRLVATAQTVHDAERIVIALNLLEQGPSLTPTSAKDFADWLAKADRS
jgi:hypothetical protein